MFRNTRRRGAMLALAGTVALVLASAGCEEDTAPVITKLSVTPQCGVIAAVPPGVDGNATQDTLYYLEASFFARASSGNQVSDPTGANSALEWRWDLDGDGDVDATNVVNPKFRFTEPGDYVARLEVEDDDGDKVSATVTIQVREAATELDALTIVAASETQLRIAAGSPVNNTLDEEGEEIPLDQLPLDERFVFDAQPSLQGWAAVFDGQLEVGCSVTELFSQFDWVWRLSNGTTLNDVNPVRVQRGANDYAPIGGRVTVTEIVTGVTRTDSTTIAAPAGVLVGNGTYLTIAPGATDQISVRGLMLQDVTELSFGIEYYPDAMTLESVDAERDLQAAGFTAQVDMGTPGRVDFTFTSGTALTGNEPDIELAVLNFRLADVALEAPTLRPMRVRDLQIARGEQTVDSLHRDGFIRADIGDCNENGLGDTMELLARSTFIDITGESVIDFCADCNDNATKDGLDIIADPELDIDSNGLPDDCDCNSNGSYDAQELRNGVASDDDTNGEPDDCDCDWNGRRDLTEIREDPSFTPIPNAEGLIVDYTSDLDQLGGGSDYTLDFCQDCDDDGIFDTAEFTLLPTDTPQQILTRFRLDVDMNQKLDECDCDLSDQYDRGELERQANGGPIVDADNDGRIDACDCDDDGELDILQIAAGILTPDDIDYTIRTGNPPLVTGFRSNVDVNGDLELDRCADCNGNGTQDGTDIAMDRFLDIDVNGLPDTCDCDSNDKYDPDLDATNDVNADGVLDLCDCDASGVADLRQIAAHPSTVLQFSGEVVVGYTSDIDQFTLQPDSTIVAGTDLVPDVCQDCDANGVADIKEGLSGSGTRPRDLDRNGKLDACDCDSNGAFDVVDIAENPSLDADDDGLIDSCDCNDDGQNDLTQMGAVANFNNRNIYTGSNIDTNANLVLDECEGLARRAVDTGTARAERR